jgi:hypothetical protein
MFQINKSPVDAFGWLTAHVACSVLLPLTVQSPASINGGAMEGLTDGEIDDDGLADGDADGDKEADGD